MLNPIRFSTRASSKSGHFCIRFFDLLLEMQWKNKSFPFFEVDDEGCEYRDDGEGWFSLGFYVADPRWNSLGCHVFLSSSDDD